MTRTTAPDRFRLWRRILPLAGLAVGSILPVPDLITRIRIRRQAEQLVNCNPWPGDKATSKDAAQLALLRLLWLQKQTRRAVRWRHREAAVMLARAATEALIVGAWCARHTDAVAKLENANIKGMRDAVRYLERAFDVPPKVIDECIARIGTPRAAPKIWTMAEKADLAVGEAYAVRDIYQRLYTPLSNFTVHSGPGSLLRHVRSDGVIRHRPARAWNRRSPARVADTCLGYLAVVIADDAGRPHQHFMKYADRHNQRTLLPLAVMVAGHATSAVRRQHIRHFAKAVWRIVGIVRSMGTYAWSETTDPLDVRTTKIRQAYTDIGNEAGIGDVMDALEPFVDYLANKVASEMTQV